MHAIHELKCHPVEFQRTDAGIKRHEIRETNRDFQLGDILHLREWDPNLAPMSSGYTGNEIYVRVLYISMPGTWGLPIEICVMTIEVIDEPETVNGG